MKSSWDISEFVLPRVLKILNIDWGSETYEEKVEFTEFGFDDL